MVDSRAARVLEPGPRSMLDDDELAWLDEQMRGDVDHLLIGTSLPFLLPPGLHYVEAWSEALGQGRAGASGRPASARSSGRPSTSSTGRRSRTRFQRGRADGRRGRRRRARRGAADGHVPVRRRAPQLRRRGLRPRRRLAPARSRIMQAVCSPIRNPLPRKMRFATAVLAYGVAGPIGHVVARSAKVPDAPLRWQHAQGARGSTTTSPTLEVRARRAAHAGGRPVWSTATTTSTRG